MNFSIGYQNTIYLQVFKALMAFVFVIQIDIGMKEKIDHGNSRKQWPAAIIPLVIITETFGNVENGPIISDIDKTKLVIEKMPPPSLHIK